MVGTGEVTVGGGGEGVAGVASIVPMTICVPLGATLTIICLPSGVVRTFWPPAVVEIEDPSGAIID